LDRASPPLEQVRGFGDLLHDHVRFEERQIFDPLQQELPEDVLTALGQASDARDRAFDLGPLNRLR